MIPFNENFLTELLSLPTAPFREGMVKTYLFRKLKEFKIPHFEDPAGNVIVGAASAKDYQKKLAQKSEEPLRFFIAHMDHPGFHGVKWNNTDVLSAKWYGGSPKAFLEEAKVSLTNGLGIQDEGKILSVKMNPAKTAIEELTIRVVGTGNKNTVRAEDLYGSFRFRSPIWKENDIYYTKAADDLVGVFSIVSLAQKLSGKPFLGLLTRAEEVGFIGAIHHFDLGWLKKRKRPVLCISLETSRTLPGAEIGKGPVIRLGDRNTPFDPASIRIFQELAEKKFKGKYQRRIMDGGTCEGSVSIAHGFPTIGISVPLGNYHNQSLEGGPDSRGKDGPAPEFIHQKDIEGLLFLCELLVQNKFSWKNPWQNQLKKFQASKKAYLNLIYPKKRKA